MARQRYLRTMSQKSPISEREASVRRKTTGSAARFARAQRQSRRWRFYRSAAFRAPLPLVFRSWS
jgi:hypothetical protein